MPSTAWSIGASSKTMLAALPPSSRVTFFFDPATAFAMARPTSVEPVNATLSTSSCETIAWPVRAGAGEDVHHAGRQVGLLADLGEQQRGQGSGLGRLEHDRVAARQRRGDLPGQHQEREVPRDHLAGDAQGLRVGSVAGVLQLVGPAGVVEEVRRRRRDVDVARLLDRLAVVDRLEHGDLAGALLDDPRDPEEVLARARPRSSSTRPGCRRGGRPSRPGRRRRRPPRRPPRAPPRCSARSS